MSEALFLKRQMEKFVNSHPREDGWKVYEFSENLQCELDLGYIVDFLRDCHPEAIKRRVTTDEVRTPDMLGEKGDSHQIEPQSDWDLKNDLDTYDWTGTLELEWQDQPIHYLSFRSSRIHLYGAAGLREDADTQGLG